MPIRTESYYSFQVVASGVVDSSISKKYGNCSMQFQVHARRTGDIHTINLLNHGS